MTHHYCAHSSLILSLINILERKQSFPVSPAFDASDAGRLRHATIMNLDEAGDGMGFAWCPICPEIPWLQHVPIYMGHTLNQPTSRFTSSKTSIDLSKTWLCDNFPVECYERCDLGLHWLPFSLCLSAFVWILATSCDNNWKGSHVCRIGHPSYTALFEIGGLEL